MERVHNTRLHGRGSEHILLPLGNKVQEDFEFWYWGGKGTIF